MLIHYNSLTNQFVNKTGHFEIYETDVPVTVILMGRK